MNGKQKKLPMIYCGILSLLLLSIPSGSSILSTRGHQITLHTDAPQYYQEEQVIISGILTENGTGMPYTSVCVNVNDSTGTPIFGTCMLTTGNGTFTVYFTLAADAVFGVYNVTADNVDLQVVGYTTFEVVSITVTAEAHGPYTGFVGTPVSFQGSATGGKQPYIWSWVFGDNDTADEQNPQHSYTTPGAYTVQLTVTDVDYHQGTDTAQATIAEPNHAPAAPSITGPTEGKRGTLYSYNVTTSDQDNDTISYMIDWGDGQTTTTDSYPSGQLVTVQHTWAKKGTYTIRAKAVDEYQAESTWATLTVTMPTTFSFVRSPFIQTLMNLIETLLQ